LCLKERDMYMKHRRVIALFCICCTLFTGLYLRIGAIMSNPNYVQAAKKQSSYTLSLPVSRGTIYDCNMSSMVNEGTDYIASVLPTEENYTVIAKHNTDYSKTEIQELYSQGKPFLCHMDTYEIQEEGIFIFPISKRYSDTPLAAHVIGYLDHEGNGTSGIEKAYDSLLTKNSAPTTLTYVLDGTGDTRSEEEPVIQYGNSPENGIVLTIDKTIQSICEKAGASKIEKGAIVVMECKTGKLRAVCSFPNFDPNNLEQSLEQEENAPLINRAFTPACVGSSFKVAVAAAALDAGYDPAASYSCTGVYQLGQQNFHCHLRTGHGTMDLKNALMVSCNPFFINLGLNLNNPDLLLKTANDLSFGKQYELAPGLYTQAGTLPTLEQLEDPGQTANFCFGQGVLTATPVQLAQMMSSVVNGGLTPTPILVEGTTQDGKTILTQNNHPATLRAMSQQTADLLKQDLIACVMEREGQNAKPSLVTAGGKTATAQTGVYVDGVEQTNGGFVGFFPAEDPVYAVAILTENAVSGNDDASPVFQEIADNITLAMG
jgi:penicillin-binding protein 2